MSAQLLRFTFPPAVVTEPIIYQLGQQFDVVTNIRRANVSRDQGWVILDIQGTPEEIDRAVRWAGDRGVLVEAVEEGLGN